jgi:subtilisin family serine protease
MRILVACLTAAAVVGTGLVSSGPAGAASGDSAVAQAPTDYIVLHAVGSGSEETKAAVKAAGGSVLSTNEDLGYVVARSSSTGFVAKVDAAPGVLGAARNRVIGAAPAAKQATKFQIEKMALLVGKGEATTSRARAAALTAEPLADLQWDMKMIDATTSKSYAKQPGSKRVMVGIIDTGIDGSHPDIAPNFDANLSRNFTTDMPDIDGPCEVASCVDPADVDDNEHGTHVASTIGSPLNGLGMAGVAPNVTLVNLRAGQDSGYFFLKATLDALTYAGKIGIDVVNMSYYTDPWLYNCLDNPADSPAERQEQKVVREATQRALDFARGHGVLPIAAEGNGATDLGKPVIDTSSPDYPADAAKERTIDNSCITVPTESRGVVAVSSIGPSKRKAYYSDYGIEQTDISAPGGDAYDTADGTRDATRTILAAIPARLAAEFGYLNPDGTPNTPAVVQNCKGTVCGYYQYLQGTSMAAPHAAGVAALIVSEYGNKDSVNGGLELRPGATESKLLNSAKQQACPTPRTFHYRRILANGTVVETDHTCEGSKYKNGFYGRGIVNAKEAVSGRL